MQDTTYRVTLFHRHDGDLIGPTPLDSCQTEDDDWRPGTVKGAPSAGSKRAGRQAPGQTGRTTWAVVLAIMDRYSTL
jgi:hypothetical protein